MLRVEYEDGKIVVGKFTTDKPVHSYGGSRKIQRNRFINDVLKANGYAITVPSSHKYKGATKKSARLLALSIRFTN